MIVNLIWSSQYFFGLLSARIISRPNLLSLRVRRIHFRYNECTQLWEEGEGEIASDNLFFRVQNLFAYKWIMKCSLANKMGQQFAWKVEYLLSIRKGRGGIHVRILKKSVLGIDIGFKRPVRLSPTCLSSFLSANGIKFEREMGTSPNPGKIWLALPIQGKSHLLIIPWMDC